MKVDKELKEKVKQKKLNFLQVQYYTIELDKVALESVGDEEGAKELGYRMESIKKAYEAINAL